MELWCNYVVFLLLHFLKGCYSEDVLNSLNGNISVLSQHLDVTTVVLKDGHTIRYPPQFQSGKQSLRLPCHTCDPSYNIFQIDNHYLIPNSSNVHVLSRNDGYSIDIGSCNPLLLHLGKAGVVWIYCAAQGKSVDVVELRRRTDNTWYAPDGGLHRFPLRSSSASRNSLLSVREKDGENISFMYFTDGGVLIQRGLEDRSSHTFRKPSSLCATIQELFYVNEDLIMMQCALKMSPENSGLVLLNISQPSANPEFFHELGAFSGTVHISDGIVILLISEIVIIRNAVNATKVEQVIGLQAQLSSQGIFVRVRHTTYFMCTSRNAVYFIDVARALEGNNTAYVKKDSNNEICVDNKCVMQYMSGILFVPLKMSDNPDGLALYSMDPIELITTIYAVIPYRYFFTLELSTENKSNAEAFGEEPKGNSSQNVGSIVGSTVGGVIVFIVATLVIVVIIYVYYKRRTQYYYQYQTAEVRFDSENDSIVIVPGRFNNPVWNFNDGHSSSEATDDTQPSTLNNKTSKKSEATNAALKEKNTNVVGSNARHDVNDDEGCYGVETREDQISLKEYIDGLVIGTMQH